MVILLASDPHKEVDNFLRTSEDAGLDRLLKQLLLGSDLGLLSLGAHGVQGLAQLAHGITDDSLSTEHLWTGLVHEALEEFFG